VTDAAGPEGRFGLPGLVTALSAVRAGAGAEELLDAAVVALEAFRGGGAAQDDAVLLVIRRL
jgi:serine phosphatase RsbU (regulator of sigma subunit)